MRKCKFSGSKTPIVQVFHKGQNSGSDPLIYLSNHLRSYTTAGGLFEEWVFYLSRLSFSALLPNLHAQEKYDMGSHIGSYTNRTKKAANFFRPIRSDYITNRIIMLYMTKTKEAQEAIGRSYGIYQVQFICQGHCNKMHCWISLFFY